MSKKLTDVRLHVLRNVAEGKKPYTGFDGPTTGGAIRSVQCWRDLEDYMERQPDDTIKITKKGWRALAEAFPPETR